MTIDRTQTLAAVSTYLASRAGLGDDLASGLLNMVKKAMDATTFVVLDESSGEMAVHHFATELDRLVFLAEQETGSSDFYCADLRGNRFEHIYLASPGRYAFTEAVSMATAMPGWIGGPAELMARVHGDKDRVVLRTIDINGQTYSMCVYSNERDAKYGWEDAEGAPILLGIDSASDTAALDADLHAWLATQAIETPRA